MRSYLKRTKGHAGYWACDRCVQKGEMINRTMMLTNVSAPLRKDEDFLSYHVNDFSRDEHIPDPKDISPFVKINFNMVSGFVIDSMHTVFEGAFSSRLQGLAFHPLEGKLTPRKLAQVEERIQYFKYCKPYEFDRCVGKFCKVKNYKIHVLRQFLYYYLFPVFHGILDEDILEHIMLLQQSMLLMGAFDRKPVAESRLSKAEQALKSYSVELFERNIPCRFTSHQTTHTHQDPRTFECGIEQVSCWVYENFQPFFTRIIRHGHLVAEQIRNRCIEKAKYQLPTSSSGTIISNKVELLLESKKRKRDGLVMFHNKGEKWPKKMIFSDFELSNQFSNNVCLLKDGSVVVCDDFIYSGTLSSSKTIGRKFLLLEPAFLRPFKSSDYHIVIASKLSKLPGQWMVSDIVAKMYPLPMNPISVPRLDNEQQKWFLSPIFHTLKI